MDKTYTLAGHPEVELHSSVTRGPLSLPTVNLYATRKGTSSLLFALELDLTQTERVIELLESSMLMVDEWIEEANGAKKQ